MSRELLQQALDALEEAIAYTSSPSWSPSMTEECTAVAASIRAYLTQPPATSADYAMGYAEGFNDACKPAQPAAVTADEQGCVACVMCGAPAAPVPVPLTDDEMFFAIRHIYGTDESCRKALIRNMEEFRAIEAALKGEA